MLKLTDSAVKQFRSMVRQSHSKKHGVRIYTEPGCCGPALAMGIAEGAEKGDLILENDGVKVFIEKKANKMLSGATLDYSSKEGIIISGTIKPSSCCR